MNPDGLVGRALASLLRRIRWIGVEIHPFLVVREGAGSAFGFPGSDRFVSGFIEPDDVAQIARLDPYLDEAECEERLREGKLCYAVKDGSKVVALMWCDLRAFNFPPHYRRLQDDEAYLFGAMTDPAFRGRNLAPLMRSRCYDSLREIGRHTFWSYTDFFNSPARRFKEKLSARDEMLRVHVALFGRFEANWTLRRYR